MVAYEKGFSFLRYLESLVGSSEFLQFFQAYLSRFESCTLTSNEFKEFFLAMFSGNDKIRSIDWEAWFYHPGMPPVIPELDRTLANDAERLAEFWVAGNVKGRIPPSLPNDELPLKSTPQIVCFLDTLLALSKEKPFTLATLQAMDDRYNFYTYKNSEILFRYCLLAIAVEDPTILPVTLRFITTQGRLKFVRPLYRALHNSKMGKQVAVSTFLKHKDFYHPICAKMIAADLRTDILEEDSPPTERNFLMTMVGSICVVSTAALVLFRQRKIWA